MGSGADCNIRPAEIACCVPVGFLPEMPSLGCGGVGQLGFIAFFKVTFDLLNRETESQPHE